MNTPGRVGCDKVTPIKLVSHFVMTINLTNFDTSAVVTFVLVLVQIFYGFDTIANFKIYMTIEFLGQIGVIGDGVLVCKSNAILCNCSLQNIAAAVFRVRIFRNFSFIAKRIRKTLRAFPIYNTPITARSM